MTTKDTQQPETENNVKRSMRGIVVSDRMDKTVVVKIERFVKHPKYKKYYKKSKTLKAHDEKNEYAIGDRVEISSTRPISKDKSFVVVGRYTAQ